MLTELLPKPLYEPSLFLAVSSHVILTYSVRLSVSLFVLYLNLVQLFGMFKQDINKLESVQRKFAKRLKGLRNFSYEAID